MTTISLQIVSDLHIEFPENKIDCITPKAPILCLLGDICSIGFDDGDHQRMHDFLTLYSPKFKYIIWVPGNHEFYTENPNNTHTKILGMIKALAKTFKNVIVLHNQRITISLQLFNSKNPNKKITILGTTLWTKIPKCLHSEIPELMSDYDHIFSLPNKLITCESINRWHATAVKFLEDSLKEEKNPTIILTHHKPFIGLDHNKTSERAYAYESDQSRFFKKPAVLWGYGHTHRAFDREVNGLRIVSNPRGYPKQPTNYVKNKIVEIAV